MAPVNRCQSPISTASPNPVRVDTPRRQHNRRTTGVNSLFGGHLGDRPVQPVPAGRGQQHRLQRGVVRQLQPGRSNRCPRSQTSCAPVHGCPPEYTIPCRSSSFDTRCRDRIRSPRTSSRARTRSRAASCSTVGYPDLDDLIHPQQARQVQRVPGIGLDPITRRALQLRRRRHHTPDPRRGQLPGQPEPGRARLVGHRDRRRQLRQPRRTPPMRRATAGARDTSPVTVVQIRTPRSTGRAHPGRHSYAPEHRGLPQLWLPTGPRFRQSTSTCERGPGPPFEKDARDRRPHRREPSGAGRAGADAQPRGPQPDRGVPAPDGGPSNQ